jgi:uncharacterized protein YjiS (DUF1127 family)
MSLNTISANDLLVRTQPEVVVERVSALGRIVRRIIEVRRQREALMALDDRMLADIGLGRSEAYREASRSMLDLPSGDLRRR